ncbi:hypothetical protein K440DRAFT_678416 [Wilcoxina mikolae CBS 423.85]|nr:hypothetical protein K440DRAFT_678416 [Wilcoxina mikolae CBS 423.85]
MMPLRFLRLFWFGDGLSESSDDTGPFRSSKSVLPDDRHRSLPRSFLLLASGIGELGTGQLCARKQESIVYQFQSIYNSGVRQFAWGRGNSLGYMEAQKRLRFAFARYGGVPRLLFKGLRLSGGPKRGVILPTGGRIPNYFAESAIIFPKGAHFMSSGDLGAIVVYHEAGARTQYRYCTVGF